MLLILEGLNGTGKSTYAQALAKRLGAPVFRPFRQSGDIHLGKGEGAKLVERLGELAIFANCHVEDIILADFAAAVPLPTVILDRSLPSALVYGMREKQTLPRREEGAPRFAYTPEACQELFEMWEARLEKAGALWVHLVAPYSVIKERTKGRSIPSRRDAEALDRAYQRLFQRTRLPRMAIDTGSVEVERGVERIVAALEERRAGGSG